MADAASIRRQNLLSVLREIERAGDCTASALQARTGLSAATVSRVLTALKERGMVVQHRKETSEPGRKPDVFRLDLTFGHYLYFTLDNRSMRGYLLDLGGAVRASARTPITQALDAALLADILAEQKTRLSDAGGCDPARLLAVIIAIPGVADGSGTVSSIPDFPQFENVPLGSVLQKALQLPCFVYNTTAMMAMGEYLRSGGSAESFVYINITDEYGIGAGILLGGELYMGSGSRAGEIGGMLLSDTHPAGDPLHRSTLEEQAGLERVYRQAQLLLDSGYAPALHACMERAGTDQIRLQLLEQAAQGMDLDILALLDRSTRIWAAAIVNLVTVLSPETVIVGGAVSRENTLICQMLQRQLDGLHDLPIRLRFAEPDSDAHVLGAVQLSKDYVFDAALGA